MLSKFINELNNKKAEFQRKSGEATIIKNNIDKFTKEIKEGNIIQERNIKLSSILKKAAEMSRDNTKEHLEKVVTSALQYVFGKDYEFVIELSEQRGTASADFYIKYKDSDHEIKVKPEDSTGGGVIDIISIALRFAFLELLGDPVISSPIILDEPAKMVSPEAAIKMGSLIKELNKSFGRQVIMSTHNEVYGMSADKELIVTQVGLYSTVKSKGGKCY